MEMGFDDDDMSDSSESPDPDYAEEADADAQQLLGSSYQTQQLLDADAQVLPSGGEINWAIEVVSEVDAQLVFVYKSCKIHFFPILQVILG